MTIMLKENVKHRIGIICEEMRKPAIPFAEK